MSLPRYEQYKDSGMEWIGEIPEGWEVKRLKYVARICTEKAEEGAEKVALENIESKTGRYITTDTAFEGEGIRFNQGNILYGKLRPYLAKVWVADFDGAAVGDFFVITTEHHFSSTYLKYRLLSEEFTDLANGSTFGSKMPRVDKEFLTDLPFAVPSLPEQTAIASFLDRKTAEIDQLITNKEKLIALYEEEKTAIINRAVTKGLNSDVTTKPSGVDWLGDIPEHWEVKRLKRVASKITDGEHISPTFTFEGMPFLSAKDVREDHVVFSNDKFVSFEDGKRFRKRCNPENQDLLLVSRGATIGRVAIVDTDVEFCLLGSVILIKPTEKIIPAYLLYCLKNKLLQDNFLLTSQSSAQQAIYLVSVVDVAIACPEKDEQTAIVAHIETECSRLDAIIDKFKKQIELFKEYRTTLISEVVTGKIDVRGEATL